MNSPKPSQIDALAYTQGEDIYVAPGQERHLPHEGWHAVQQRQGRVRPTAYQNGVPINDDQTLEREADTMGAKALHAGAAAVPPTSGRGQDGSAPDILRETITRKRRIQRKFGSVAVNENSVSAVSQSVAAQRQTEESTEFDQAQNNVSNESEASRREYREYIALEPEGGAGSRETSASVASGSGGGSSSAEDASQLMTMPIAQLAGCTPANTAVGSGALSFVENSRESWRSHVTYRAIVDNQSDHLFVSMYVFAKAYYGFPVWEHLNFSATVDLTCQTVDNKCEIGVNERGGSVWDLLDSPASGAISIQTNRRAGGTQNALTVRVGGGVEASSSVSAGVGPYSAGVSFPNASISHKMSMGTFIYTCRES